MDVRRIAIKDIKVKDRARTEKGDIESLAATIKEKGLLQPITVDQNLRLLAGERRLLAHIHNNETHIDAVIRNSPDILDALEIELIENANRKDMTWVENSKLQKRIFEEKSKKQKWNQSKQAEMLKSSQPMISRQIKMAEALELLPELAEKNSFDEAWKELKSLEEDMYVEMQKQAAAKPQKPPPQMAQIKWNLDEDRAWEVYKHMHADRFAGRSSGEEHAMKQAFSAGYAAGKEEKE